MSDSYDTVDTPQDLPTRCGDLRCKPNGISHSPDEFTELAYCKAGAEMHLQGRVGD